MVCRMRTSLPTSGFLVVAGRSTRARAAHAVASHGNLIGARVIGGVLYKEEAEGSEAGKGGGRAPEATSGMPGRVRACRGRGARAAGRCRAGGARSSGFRRSAVGARGPARVPGSPRRASRGRRRLLGAAAADADAWMCARVAMLCTGERNIPVRARLVMSGMRGLLVHVGPRHVVC
jgi:hypothetical protein